VKSFSSPGVGPLSTGDWPGFWATWGIAVPPELKAYFETNDPRAMSAVSAAGYESGYTGDVTRIATPTLLYCGANDPFAPAMPMDAEILGVELHLIPGHDHVGTFQAVDDVLPLALKHLQLHSGA
jgi:pimeloyl-ACP methyl ester carboxylesterase